MAIQDLGESLLANAKQQRKDDEKRRRKEAERAALALLAGKAIKAVGNSYIEQKAMDFLNNEKNQAERISMQRAMQGYQEAENIRSQAEAHKGGVEGYLIDFYTDKNYVTLASKQDGTIADSSLRAYARSLAMNNLEKYRKEYDDYIGAAKTFGEQGLTTAESYGKLIQKKVPTTLTDALVRGTVNLFTSKDKEATIFNEFLTSDQVKTAEELEAAREIFKATRNAPVAQKILTDAKDVKFRLAPRDFIIKDLEVEVPDQDGVMRKEKVLKVIDKVSGQVLNTITATGEDLSVPTRGQQNLITRAQNLPDNRIMSQAQEYMQIVGYLPDEVQTNIQSLGKQQGAESENAALAKAAVKSIHGTANILKRNILAEYPDISSGDATKLAYTMMSLDKEFKDDNNNLSLLYDESGRAPLLILAAQQHLSPEEGFFGPRNDYLKSKLDRNTVQDIVDDPAFLDNLKRLNAVEQKKAVTWLEDYEIFTTRFASDRPTILEMIKLELNIGE